MANFNLADYETVEERIKRFYETHADGRIVTHDYTSQFDRESGVWRVQAMVFESSADQAANLVKATGFAFEIDGTMGANKTSALEFRAYGRHAQYLQTNHCRLMRQMKFAQ